MKRREFLNISAKLSATPLVLGSVPVGVFQPLDLLQAVDCDTVRDRILVVIQMRGGNDGINTIIPIEQYDTYSNLRPDIRIRQQDYIPLDSTLPLADQVALHPSMTGIKSLYDSGYANIIQGTGYASHNRSHFKSTDLYLTGGDSRPERFNLQEGWMGKYLTHVYEQIIAHPQRFMQDPVGLQFGNKKPSLGFHTFHEHAAAISMSGQDPAGFFTLISEVGQQAPMQIPNSDYGDKLNHILGVENDTNTYAKRISDVFNCGRNSDIDYPDTYLANQLKTVARLMHGGCKTKVYLVDMTGFDNHVNQTDADNTATGAHQRLLEQLSDGVKFFMDDLEAMGLAERAAIVTFSEFGRTADQNESRGTDHGTVSPMFVFGKNISPGVTGTNINLSELDNRAPTGFQYDYRRVFTGLLRDWLGVGDDTLMATGFTPWAATALPLIASQKIAAEACPLPTQHENSVFANADDPHTFSVTVPIPEHPAGVTNAPAMELTDCDYVVLAPGFHAPEGSNLRIFPSLCTETFDGQQLRDPKIEFEAILNEHDDFGEIEAYPNPFIDSITASFKPNNDEKNINVQITDNVGKLIRIPIVHSYSYSGYYNLIFDGSNLAKGVYYVVFFSEKRRKTIKVLKQ